MCVVESEREHGHGFVGVCSCICGRVCVFCERARTRAAVYGSERERAQVCARLCFCDCERARVSTLLHHGPMIGSL